MTFLCCIPRRRKHQFLVVAAVYVFCSMGMMHQDFPFQLFNAAPHSFSRAMAAEDLSYYPRNSPSKKEFKYNPQSILKRFSGGISKHKRIKWERAKLDTSQWEEDPVFVFNLPGSATQTAFRYFKCGLGGTQDIALYWAKVDEGTALQGTTKKNSRHEIGKCFRNNLRLGNLPLEGCGQAKVWASMGYSSSVQGQCFYPSMDPSATEALAQTYPKATILQILQDPDEWYETSYPRFRTNLATSCRDLAAPIPGRDASREDWIKFYKWHESSVREFARSHPSLKYVEVDLKAASTNATIATLKEHLGLPSLCWQPPKKQVNRLERSQQPRRQRQSFVEQQADSPREKGNELFAPPHTQLTYPIFVASLPKSGTTSTQRFFQCGLGYDAAAHHWTEDKETGKNVKIGKCMESNMQNNRSVFEDCGDFQVWSDLGYMDERSRHNKLKEGEAKCFFPSIHGGLEAFHQSHPNGTILNVLRDPDQWYESAMAWRKLPERLARRCSGFPPPNSSSRAWRQFYRWHTFQVRRFAQTHPSLTYLELSLEANDTGAILEEHTGIPSFCWGDCNPNPNKGSCGVLKKMRHVRMAKAMSQKQARDDYVAKWQESSNHPGVAAEKKTDNDEEKKPFLRNPRWSSIERKFSMFQLMPVQHMDGQIEPLPSDR